eukprot:scaffold70889_cov45-Phaeocystis_antarctica.AAC.3
MMRVAWCLSVLVCSTGVTTLESTWLGVGLGLGVGLVLGLGLAREHLGQREATGGAAAAEAAEVGFGL